MRASSPASTGPAGAHFEGQVGAHYLLTMLIGAEPRGLPGTTINKVAFQQAGVGYPLDDIIVHAHDREGCSAILQIQVKRNATFAPSDEVFGKVVSQVAEAARSHDFTSTRNELAIAISRRSSNIDGPYQDVLTWARWDSAETFKRRISQPGSANDAMRTFVSTFRNNLSKAGAEHDDETVRHLLSRFQILPFDFTAPDSAIAVWDKERAAGALHPDDVGHAGDFRRRLVELAIDTATSGGHLTQETLNEHLRNGAFRLAGERRYSTARSALVEASQHALAEIDDRIGGVTLSRGDQRALVRVALEQGRCVEIRGDGGVGKSALLKHFAEQLATEAPIIVLRPGRTTPGGWTAMKSVLEFDGTARELLVDLASSGGATLFLDGLDFFTDVERRTVADLVREAAGVPGFVVVATARREFDSEDQPNWLPADALDSLGRGAPVVIGELSATEVDELRRAAPELAALLGEGHPARAVARNLFRLARLTKSSAGEQMLRTEIDMAEQWWRTADGERDSGHRERDRLLHALAEQALARTEPLDTSDHPPAAVDALVQSQTLSDLGGDRMAFRHDVFRDWAVANLLYGQTESRKGLPLQGPAPAALVRGVELAARMALERGCDDSDWHKLLDEVSCRGAHGSWRRAVLLALVRSEIGIDLLPRVSEILLAANASLLRELIRTVMAVDVRPAREFAIPGADAAIIPPYMNVPGGPSWWRLISWLLDVSASLPPAAILDVVNLYAGWSFLGDDQLTPRIVEWLHRWLREIETAEYPDDLRELRHASAGELGVDHVRSLETKLRDAFLAFCYHNPPLAAEYIRSMMHHTMTSGVDSVITSPGSLVLAAPEELADLTIAKLLPEPVREQSERSNPFRLRYLFLQPHPDLGPFLGLLTHAQDVGMNLIRRIVDHAVSCSGAGKSHGSKAINIRLADDDREFRWTQSYTWARAWGRGHPCVTTALLALEQWGHRRIADGDSLDDVVADVLGPSGSPAAYLLVVVDIVLKHWPVSREAAVPLVACPELLCLDLDRALNERFGANLTNSAARSAHHSSLFDLLATYAISGPSDGQREHLVSRLGTATERLGPYSERSHRGHPDFMAAHALNLLNPDNWKSVNHVDGTPEMEYVAPDVEARHLARLRDDSRGRLADDQLRVAIKVAVDDRTMSSPKLAADAAEWAQGSAEFTEDRWLLVAAALLTIRDGTDNLRATKEAWARTVFADAVQIQEDHVHGVPSGLRFNAVAIAFAGAVHLLTRRPPRADIQKVLELAARDDCAAVPGFRAVAGTLETIDECLPRAVLRTAFAACIRVRAEQMSVSANQHTAALDTQRHGVQSAVDAELSWLTGSGVEPGWPQFPLRQPRIRSGFRMFADVSSREESGLPQLATVKEYVNHQAAAEWLSSAADLFDYDVRPWLREIVSAYAQWTAVANGSELDVCDAIDSLPHEWNDAYLRLLAYCLTGMEASEIDVSVLNLITSLPDEAFFSATERFLYYVDKLYCDENRIQAPEAVQIRSVLGDRLLGSRGWKNWEPQSMPIEVNLNRAVAAMFLNDGWLRQPRCYLRPDGVGLIEPLLPSLQRLAVSRPCFDVALNLIEVDPRPFHLPFIVTVTEAWLTMHSDNGEFWVDYAVGRRVCALIDAIRLLKEPPLLDRRNVLRSRVDYILATLIGLGVAEAARLEETLADTSG